MPPAASAGNPAGVFVIRKSMSLKYEPASASSFDNSNNSNNNKNKNNSSNSNRNNSEFEGFVKKST